VEFTPNQKNIIQQIKLANEPLSLEELMTRHFSSEFCLNKCLMIDKTVEKMIFRNSSGLYLDGELKDFFFVLIFLQENKLVYSKQYQGKDYLIVNHQNEHNTSDRPDLTRLLEPFWGIKVSPTFALFDFIENGYKTTSEKVREIERELTQQAREQDRKLTKEAREQERELTKGMWEKEFELNEKRYKEEHDERMKEKKWRIGSLLLTIFATLSAIIIPPIIQSKMANKEMNVNFKKNDTIKVMNYNPPIDTGLKINNFYKKE
jgi:hypothetical protein